MAKVQVVRGATSYIARVFVQDTSKTDGSGLAGLVFNSASLTAYYIRQGDATATAIALVTATVGTFTSSGFKEVDSTNLPGVYEVGIPNAALSSGVSVLVMLKGATNMAPVLLEIELDSVNNQDAVRFGLSALPNAAAGASGGLPTGDGSGRVTVVTNADKTGYALTSGEHTLISGTDVEAALTTQGLTTTRAAKLDDLDAAVSSRLAATADPTTALTEIAGDTDTLITNVALQATATALATAQTAITEIATDTDTIITNQGAQATASALATAQTAITEIAGDTDSLLTGQALQATAAALTTAQTGITEIAGDTDTLLTNLATVATNLSTVNGNVVAVPAEVWAVLTSTLTAAGSVGAYLLAKLDATITSRLASGAVTLDLTQAIPVSPRPTIGTTGEALAAARAYAIGNESASGNAAAIHASDDSTVLSTLTYAPTIDAPTSRTRS